MLSLVPRRRVLAVAVAQQRIQRTLPRLLLVFRAVDQASELASAPTAAS
jgi:hypothetical protein